MKRKINKGYGKREMDRGGMGRGKLIKSMRSGKCIEGVCEEEKE